MSKSYYNQIITLTKFKKNNNNPKVKVQNSKSKIQNQKPKTEVKNEVLKIDKRKPKIKDTNLKIHNLISKVKYKRNQNQTAKNIRHEQKNQ